VEFSLPAVMVLIDAERSFSPVGESDVTQVTTPQ